IELGCLVQHKMYEKLCERNNYKTYKRINNSRFCLANSTCVSPGSNVTRTANDDHNDGDYANNNGKNINDFGQELFEGRGACTAIITRLRGGCIRWQLKVSTITQVFSNIYTAISFRTRRTCHYGRSTKGHW